MACILVVAPPALFKAYAGNGDARTPLRCVAHARDALNCLNEEQVAAVVCHETPTIDPEVIHSLAAWYNTRRTNAPLLAVVADLTPQGRREHLLYPRASLLFSRYHSRPSEIISFIRQWAFPEKRGKKPA